MVTEGFSLLRHPVNKRKSFDSNNFLQGFSFLKATPFTKSNPTPNGVGLDYFSLSQRFRREFHFKRTIV
jgi:hypothetical protein